ncbi:MAG: TonB family protein [Candidatus Eremiobacteraeota bacterium]|nr:TonB family protein [Candidatus Eremiobacteraeota bacterium]MBV9648392.1 TonB family protein [Candidatus Eremiobacteraeota bacterium]
MLSGTVTVYSGDDRYDIPFHDAVAAPDVDGPEHQPHPIVVRFPDRVTIDAAYLSAIDGPHGGPCNVGNVWFHNAPSVRSTFTDLRDQRTFEQSKAVVQIAAPVPTKEPRPCGTPDSPGRLVHASQASWPQFAKLRGEDGQVTIEVFVRSDGGVGSTRVWSSSGYKDLDDEAIRSAVTSKFEAPTFRCRRVFGTYKFYVQFFVA